MNLACAKKTMGQKYIYRGIVARTKPKEAGDDEVERQCMSGRIQKMEVALKSSQHSMNGECFLHNSNETTCHFSYFTTSILPPQNVKCRGKVHSSHT